jgi:hypothetical protein
MKTIFRTKFGSHLYGTNTATSDTDYKSVHIPEATDILLQRVKGSIGDKNTKSEGEKNCSEDIDDESYSLQRYLGLLSEGQTVSIDMLFAPDPEINTSLWGLIKMNKDRLLTTKSASFVGYCRTQANKYGIKGSRVAAAKAASEFFLDALTIHGPLMKVGDLLIDAPEIVNEFTRIVSKETSPGKFESYFECCNRLVGFKNTLKEAAGIFTKIYENYGERARKAQDNEGIDWKALSHAVRVANEAIELLKTSNITFPLENRGHILDIKRGYIPYERVADEIEKLLVEVEEASKVSVLRKEPDYAWIDSFVEEVYAGVIVKHWRGYFGL